MENDQKLRLYFLKIKNQLEQFEKFQNQDNLTQAIQYSQVINTESFDTALYCAATMQKYGTLRDARLGVVDPLLPNFLAYGKICANEVILFTRQDKKLVTIDIPYSKEEIKAQKAKGSLLATHTIINVPSRYIRPIKLI